MDDMVAYKDEFLKDKKAKRIWEEVVYAYNNYTNDSSVSKFFLPEELIVQCRPVAAAFAASLYSPQLAPEEVYSSSAYYVFLLTTIAGVQIYIKERSLANNRSPFIIEKNEEKVLAIKQKSLGALTRGVKLTIAIQQVMRKFLAQFLTKEKKKELAIVDHEFSMEKYDSILATSIIFGYYFSKSMILDK